VCAASVAQALHHCFRVRDCVHTICGSDIYVSNQHQKPQPRFFLCTSPSGHTCQGMLPQTVHSNQGPMGSAFSPTICCVITE